MTLRRTRSSLPAAARRMVATLPTKMSLSRVMQGMQLQPATELLGSAQLLLGWKMQMLQRVQALADRAVMKVTIQRGRRKLQQQLISLVLPASPLLSPRAVPPGTPCIPCRASGRQQMHPPWRQGAYHHCYGGHHTSLPHASLPTACTAHLHPTGWTTGHPRPRITVHLLLQPGSSSMSRHHCPCGSRCRQPGSSCHRHRVASGSQSRRTGAPHSTGSVSPQTPTCGTLTWTDLT